MPKKLNKNNNYGKKGNFVDEKQDQYVCGCCQKVDWILLQSPCQECKLFTCDKCIKLEGNPDEMISVHCVDCVKKRKD